MLAVTVPTPCVFPDCHSTPPLGLTETSGSFIPVRVPPTMICGTGTAVTTGLPRRTVTPWVRLVSFCTHRIRETCANCTFAGAAFPTRSVAFTLTVASPPPVPISADPSVAVVKLGVKLKVPLDDVTAQPVTPSIPQVGFAGSTPLPPSVRVKLIELVSAPFTPMPLRQKCVPSWPQYSVESASQSAFTGG